MPPGAICDPVLGSRSGKHACGSEYWGDMGGPNTPVRPRRIDKRSKTPEHRPRRNRLDGENFDAKT